MKTKKLLGMLLALTMVFSMVIIPQAVVNADYSDNVLLEYDFEDYTGGSVTAKIVPKTGSGITVGHAANTTQTNKLYAVTDETTGNTYLRSGVEGGAALTNAGFAFSFADTFTSGKYALSFDLGRGNEDSTVTSTFAIKDSGNNPRIMAAYINGGYFYGYKSNGNNAYDTEGTYGAPIAFEKNKIYRVDVVFDLDSKYSEESTANGVVSVYIDGQLLSRRENTVGLASRQIQIRMEQPTAYLDNLKIAKITNDSFEASVAYASNTAKISFTESLLTEETALDANDFTVTNAATGEAVAIATAAKTAYDEVTLTFAEGAIKKGFTYNVAFSTDVKNIAGNAAVATSFTLPADEKQVYLEEFADFKNGDIIVKDYEDCSYNNFMLLVNTTWTKNNPFKAVEAVADGEDGQAIRIVRGTRNTDGETNTHSDMAVKLPHKVYFEGDVTLEYRMKVGTLNEGDAINFFRPYLIASKDAKNYELVPAKSMSSVFWHSNNVRYINNAGSYSGTGTSYSTAVDGTAYHTYKAVYHFDSETADIYLDETKLNSEPLAITNLTAMKSNGYFDRLDMRLNGANESAYVDIDYIKVTQTSVAPYVKEVTYKDYNGNDATATTAGIKEIAVSFGGNVSEASLENVKLLDGAEEVSYNGTFDGTTRTYTMTIPSLLAGGKAYTLDLAAVTDPYGAALIGEKEYAINTGAGTKEALSVTFTVDGEAAALSSLEADDVVTITATIIDTTGAAAEEYALIGVCNNGDILSDVELDTLTWNGCVGTATAKVTVESLTDVAIKAFVFEKVGTLVPVSGSPFILD